MVQIFVKGYFDVNEMIKCLLHLELQFGGPPISAKL